MQPPILRDLAEPAVTAAIEANLFEQFRAWGRWLRAELRDEGDLSLLLTPLPAGLFNGVFAARGRSGWWAAGARVGRDG